MASDVLDLDFDSIKIKLKAYFQTQSEFNDFDFDGSGMNILLNALAYTTHYIAVHGNMSLNEAFLNRAILRNNVVSKSKELGYFPRQLNGATAQITLSITPAGTPTNIAIPKGTEFVCELDGVSYQFVTTDDTTLDPIGGGVYSKAISITQGVFTSQEWTYSSVDTDQRFIIQQNNLDTRFLTVDIKESSGSGTIVAWAIETDITSIDGTSQVFFLQEVNDEKIEIYFGDDVLGESLINNNIIIATFLTTDGVPANGCSIFSLVNDIGSYLKSEFTIVVDEKASGGADKEDNASIKHIAPKNYQMQKRAVITDDYKTLLLSNYGDIEAVNVWGGEDAVPVQFGKVFISIKPLSGNELSPASKTYIQTEILEKNNIVGIIPEIIDPEFLYVDITSDVKYDREKTTSGPGQIQSIIEAAIISHFNSDLTKFDAVFRYSNFLNVIDQSDPSILNNLTSVKMTKKWRPTIGAKTYSFKYNNAISAGTAQTQVFTHSSINFQLKDDGLGNLDEYQEGILINSKVGTINYTTGEITVISYDFNLDATNELSITATPAINDIDTVRNTLILLGDMNVSVEFITGL